MREKKKFFGSGKRVVDNSEKKTSFGFLNHLINEDLEKVLGKL